MNNDLLKTEFASLERKVTLLMGEHKRLRSELAQLKEENNGLKDEIKARDEQVASFQNKFKISKIVSSIDSESQDTSELKRKIDEYIKEIDKCIAHVSK